MGSVKIFSNEFINKSEGDNLVLLNNVLKWLTFKSQIFKITNFSVGLENSIEEKLVFSPY